MRVARLLGFVVLVVTGCGSSDSSPPTATVVTVPAASPERPRIGVDARGCAEGVTPLAPTVQRGVCYAHSYQDEGVRGYGSEVSRASLQELAAIGTTWVSLTPFGFMAGANATEVQHVGQMRAAETDERMRAEITAARDAGLSVLLKPHIWIRGGVYLGSIDPGSEEGWRAWFSSYERFIVGYARMAEELEVPLLSIGVEFASSSASREQDWRGVIRAVRAVYRGKLVYGANWDEAGTVPFWDALDYVGVQFYAPLAARLDEPRQALEARLAAHLDALGALSQRVDRPVLLTEVGYKAIRGTAVRPHEWPEHAAQPPVASDAEQALCYQLLLAGVAARPFIHGVYWWKWFSDPGSREEGPTGFSPRGRPAEAVLRAAFSERCATP